METYLESPAATGGTYVAARASGTTAPPRRMIDKIMHVDARARPATFKTQDRNMQDWKMKDRDYFTRNVVSMLCMSRCIPSDRLFSGALQINVIAILFYCDFHVLPVSSMTSCFHIMAPWQLGKSCVPKRR